MNPSPHGQSHGRSWKRCRRFGRFNRPLLSNLLLAFFIVLIFGADHTVEASGQVASVDSDGLTVTSVNSRGLSPYWGPEIQQWSTYIDSLAGAYGFHPDLIAAIIFHESDAEFQTINSLGAGGMMNLTATAPDTTLPTDALLSAPSNLNWGLAVLSYVVQQSGGDLFTALAAFNGGWVNVGGQLPREYAARVLDSYARALIIRAGVSPQMANHWTVAVEIRAGNVPSDSMIVLGNKPISGLRLFAEHVVYAFADDQGHTYYIRGYVVPVSLSEYIPTDETGPDDQLEPLLRARLGDKSARTAPGNSRVMMACLLSMERLRGQRTTRWFSPSDCPTLER